MPVVLCYGDSNTHGADPATGKRLERDVRWPGRLAAALAGTAEVIEEGLNGRTTAWDDPLVEGRNGRTYLLPCLRSHQPVDVLVLMLGTNDLKVIYRRQASEIASGLSSLVDIALGSGCGPSGGAPRVLVVAPPRLGPISGRSEVWGFGASLAASEALPRLYRIVADARGAAFLDAAALVEGDPADGVHLSPASHRVLAGAVEAAVLTLLDPIA